MEDFDDVVVDPGPAWGGLPSLASWRPPSWERQRQRQRQQQQGTADGGASTDGRHRAAAVNVFDVLAGIGDGVMTDSEEEEEEEKGTQPPAEVSWGADEQEQELSQDEAAAKDSGNGSDDAAAGSDDDASQMHAESDDDGHSSGRSSDQEEGDQEGDFYDGGGVEAGAITVHGVDPEDLVEADFDLDRSGVLARIEGVIGDTIAALAEGRLPELEFVCRAAGNTHMVPEDGVDHGEHSTGSRMQGPDSDADDEEGAVADRSRGPAAARVRLGARTRVKSMTHGQGRQAHAVARVFEVLAVVHELLRTGRQTTQRDIYYKLAGPPLFPNAASVNGAISDTVALLRVPRSRLGITCSPRGAVAGQLHVRDGAAGAWIDCGALGSAGWAVPGDLAAVERLSFRVNARFILVVEKDAIFQRLVADGLPAALSAVVVTAKGFPDLATRAFLCRLCAAAPQAVVLGLVDWNPAGAVILATFKFGNARMGLEGARYAVPRLRWLGVTSSMLGDVPGSAFKQLTPRDRGLFAGLRGRLVGQRGWLDELTQMEERGIKCDIEALYAVGGFEGLHRLLTRRVLQGQYL